jgi:hypothetical protein
MLPCSPPYARRAAAWGDFAWLGLDLAVACGTAFEEIPITPVNNSFWISVRGPLKDQATALQRLTPMMADMPEVEVEIGTIAVEP